MNLNILCTQQVAERKQVDSLLPEDVELLTVANGYELLTTLARHPVDVLVTNMALPDIPGIEVITVVRAAYPSIRVIVVADVEADSPTVGLLAATDDVTLLDGSVSNASLKATLEDSLRPLRTEQENALWDTSHGNGQIPNVVGSSVPMQDVLRVARRAADWKSTVLLLGESGTGKEQIARLIHFGSARATHPFVPVDCSSLTPTLIESELFGHVRGSFTGADNEHEGLLVAAKDGTVFLDEIGELPFALQAKLLRAIQEREVRPVGSSVTQPFAARMIAATKRDLRQDVDAGIFREDLFYRLNVVTIKLPPLRDRIDDLSALVQHFIAKFSQAQRTVTGISLTAMAALESHSWPGNVRELENVIEQSFVVGNNDIIHLRDLPRELQEAYQLKTSRDNETRPLTMARTDLAAVELRAIQDALAQASGNKREAARVLNISVATLYRKLKRCEV